MKALYTVVFFFTLNSLLGGPGLRLGKLDTYERSLDLISFDAVDVTPLAEHLDDRDELLSPRHETHYFLQKNLKYIFHNRLNKSRFLVAPDPQLVVRQISEVMTFAERLEGLLAKGRTLISEKEETEEWRSLVKQVQRTADDLKQSFSDYFLEGHTARYSFEITRSREPDVQFVNFLVQSQRINAELKETLNEYFFATSPGSVSLGHYRTSSVSTLAESMMRLSEIVHERLP